MVATLIRIPDDEYRLYKEIARERDISLAEFFRKAARKSIGREKKASGKYSFWNLGTKFVIEKGPKDGSIKHDKYYYMYEDKKRKLK